MEINRYIAIEGNIGVGKTTLTNILSAHFGSVAMLEQFIENPFLDKFYANPDKYAFLVEMYFMSIRYKQMRGFFSNPQALPTNIVSDYLFIKSLLFAKYTLDKIAYDVFKPLFELLHSDLPKPDITIYLQAPTDKILENIRVRNREYEQSITKDYLEGIENAYKSYFKEHNIKLIIIDARNADFINNPSHLSIVLDALNDNTGKTKIYTLP